MASLANQTISSTYDGLIKTSSDNAVPVSGVQALEDGSGNALALSVGRSGNGVSVSGNLAVDTNTLYVDATNNRVGVGTSSPAAGYLLDVNGGINMAYSGTGSNAINQSTASGFGNIKPFSNAGFFDFDTNFSSGGGYRFHYNGGEKMRIDSSGNVGIGTSSPNSGGWSTALSINGTSNEALELYTNGTHFLSLAAGGSSTLLYAVANVPLIFGTNNTERMRIDSSGNVTIRDGKKLILNRPDNAIDSELSTNSAGTLILNSRNGEGFDFQNGGTGAMRIDSSGNVGIGVTPKTWSVGTALEVARNGSAIWSNGQGETNIMANIYYDGGYKYAATGAYGARINLGNTNGNILFYTDSSSGTAGSTSGATERMRITSGGDVLIGTQGVTNGTSNYGASFSPSSNNRRILLTATSTTSSNTLVYFMNPNGAVGEIVVSGSSTSYLTSSDYRLKENVVEMTGALDRVDALKPSRFNFIADPEKTVDGFIAHEVAEVVPEAISGEKDAVDEEGNPIYQGIDQSKIVPLLVGAIKELSAKVAALESQLNA